MFRIAVVRLLLTWSLPHEYDTDMTKRGIGFEGRVRHMENGCVVWLTSMDEAGYGRLWDAKAGKLRYAHRVAWETTYGVILTRFDVIHHECRNKSCVNVGHLKLMTRWDHRREHGGEGPQCIHGVAPRCADCQRAISVETQRRWKAGRRKAGGCRQCRAPALAMRGACAKHLEQEAHAAMLRRAVRRDAARASA